MKLKLLVSAIALSIIAPLASAEVSVTGTVTSDYMFRGVSQTDSSPAVQVSLDYAHDNGFYAGTWVSNVDFGDDADAEIDFYAGYGAEVNEKFSWDLSYTYYTYTGYDSDEDYDYGEIIVNAYFDAFTLTYGHASDYAQSDMTAQYLAASYDVELENEYALTLQAGFNFGEAIEDTFGEKYVDYSATLAKSFNDFDFTAAIINTNLEDDDSSDLRFVLGVSRTF